MASLRSAGIAPPDVVVEGTEIDHGFASPISAPSTTTGAIRGGRG
jgi:hypothetical protein